MLASGTRLGPYEILAPLGAGGMGEVYRARGSRLGRDVAIKTLSAGMSGDPSFLRRFEHEARAASALNHPGIVTIHDVGRVEDVSFLAMEWIDGTSLREILDGRPLPIRRLLGIAAPIADGLAAAHAAGIVHRDLKPENIMIDRAGRAKILDFGLAKSVPLLTAHEKDPTITLAEPTREGTILGTFGYMAPEQASGRAADFRSDQFSFGAVLYEMATGIRAFRGDSPAETISAVLREDPRPIREIAPGTPAPLSWIVDRCLAKNPEDGRFYMAALFGFEPGENLVNTDPGAARTFRPLDLERQGFFTSGENIAVDLDHPQTSEKEGERLFGDDGEPTDTMRRIQRALGLLASGYEETERFIETLVDLRLIEPIDISLRFDDGKKVRLDGRQAAKRRGVGLPVAVQ